MYYNFRMPSDSDVLISYNTREFTKDPQLTYFSSVYKPRVNRTRETIEIPFDNRNVQFGTTATCTIPNKDDYLTGLTLRTTLPAIYPTVAGQYVYPTPSSQVGANVYAQMALTKVVASGTVLTANTTGNHYTSVGTQVFITGTTNFDGTYTVASIPTANSFTCSSTVTGSTVFTGTMSFTGIAAGDVVSYFSTQNSNLWVNNLTSKTWAITSGSFVGNQGTFTTSTPSNLPVGNQAIVNLGASYIVNKTVTITASTDTTFSCTAFSGVFLMVGTAAQAYSLDLGQTWTSVKNVLGGTYYGVGTGGANAVMVGESTFSVKQAYSSGNGRIWNPVAAPIGGVIWRAVAYGNGVYVIVGDNGQARSTDNGVTWTSATTSLGGSWYGVAYGNGVFVMAGPAGQASSTDYGVTWVSGTGGAAYNIAYGNGRFVMVGNNFAKYSTDNGVTWNSSTGTFGFLFGVAYGNGVFVGVGLGIQVRSTDNGATWAYVSSLGSGSTWNTVAYGSGVFIATGTSGSTGAGQIRSTNNGATWAYITSPLTNKYYSIAYSDATYSLGTSDTVSLVVPPLQLSGRTFTSSVYPSIQFQTQDDAAFWGFDSRDGFSYSLPATPPWTYTQSGWISGFLPPSLSSWSDSVAHKLLKSVRLMVGKQTIKEYSGEYIELYNDLTVPYENKAVLKLMNGTLDQTQAVAARQYYVSLPLGTHEIPLCALQRQQVSIDIEFESYYNLSQNLNQGTGSFTDSGSYTTFDASSLVSPLNAQATFSYNQYIFVVTSGGALLVYDTTKSFTTPSSYVTLSNLGGTLKQFCVLSSILYIGLSNGMLLQANVDQLVQGNTSSVVLNNYTPTTGTLTGTIVADFQYIYYSVTSTSTSHVFFVKYDTTKSFTSSTSYKAGDFSLTFNTGITGIYKTLTDGTQLIMLPQGSPGSLYTFQLNADILAEWYVLDYSFYGYQITEGVIIGKSIYFVSDGFRIIKYSNLTFSLESQPITAVVVGDGSQGYSTTGGFGWTFSNNPLTGKWYGVDYGNGVFVMTGDAGQAYSTNNGLSWTSAPAGIGGDWRAIAYGNGVFVITGNGTGQAYSTDGKTWIASTTSLTGYWHGIAYGNGVFVIVGEYALMGYSTDYGKNWVSVTSPLNGYWYGVAYGNGTFVAVAGSNEIARSTNNGVTWTYGPATVTTWYSITYGNGVFLASGYYTTAYSSDNGQTFIGTSATSLQQFWLAAGYGNGIFLTAVGASYVGTNRQAFSLNNAQSFVYSSYSLSGWWCGLATKPNSYTLSGTGLTNLVAVGNYIYCSNGTTAVRIDTTKDLKSLATYEYSVSVPAGQYIFAYGPRYVYMFTSTNLIQRFDPYAPDTTFQASLIVDYESLPPGVPKPTQALMPLVQTQKVTRMTDMDLHGPIKEFWITGTPASSNVFQYSNLAAQSTLALNGEQLVTADVGTRTFLTLIEPFETHTSMPFRNFSILSFELNPENETPNGTVNFSRIPAQVFNGGAQTIWASTYNILSIRDGLCGLMFN